MTVHFAPRGLARARPLPLALPVPRTAPRFAAFVPLPRPEAGLFAGGFGVGVWNFWLAREDVGGFSTKEVSLVLCTPQCR